MAIYEFTSDAIQTLEATSFTDAGLRERADLQRLLRDRIEVIAPDVLVIAEEFREWEESRRRNDLLGVDSEANLVVIELKRSDDGGHMELQALRYAAMVSAMTFDQAVEIYAKHLAQTGDEIDPRQALLEHLDWTEPDEEAFAQRVRIVLASADFSKELTTSVLWLNEQGLDIRCVRLKPYRHGERVVVDVQQLIPLPEAEAYQIRLREKQQQERRPPQRGRSAAQFEVTVGEQVFSNLSRAEAMRALVKALCAAGVDPEQMKDAVHWRKSLPKRRMFVDVPGSATPEELVKQMPQVAAAEGFQFNPSWFYLDADDLIHANGRTYALSQRWGKRTEEAIRLLLQRFPDKGIACRRSGGDNRTTISTAQFWEDFEAIGDRSAGAEEARAVAVHAAEQPELFELEVYRTPQAATRCIIRRRGDGMLLAAVDANRRRARCGIAISHGRWRWPADMVAQLTDLLGYEPPPLGRGIEQWCAGSRERREALIEWLDEVAAATEATDTAVP